MNYFYAVLSPLLFCLSFATLKSQPSNTIAGPNSPSGIEVKSIIEGRVIDASTGLPLDYATVSLLKKFNQELITGTITEADGKFSLEALPGSYTVKIEFISFEPLVIEDVEVSNKRLDLGDLQLASSAAALEEVIVVGEKSQMVMALDKKVFNVGKDLGSRGGNAAELLDNVPSIQVDVEGNVSLRGSGNVRILVNGRPSGLIGDGAGGLRNLPANLIESIEVVTNPSARYEAEGTSGIINIILKKDQDKGLNGSFDFTTGVPNNHGVAVNLNRRSQKLNFFTNLGVNYRRGPGNGQLYQEARNPNETLISVQNNERIRSGVGTSFRFGADYFLNPRNTITTAFSFRKGEDDNENLTTYRDFLNNLNTPTGIETRLDEEDESEEELEYSISYKLSFPDNRDHKLTADIRYQDEVESEGSLLTNRFFDASFNPTDQNNEVQRSGNTERQNQLILQADYVHPFGKDHQFETGIRASLRDIDNDFLVEDFNQDTDAWTPLAGLSNDFQYDEDIFAAYITYGKKIGKFSYQLGLRPEYSHVVTRLIQTDEVNDRDYLNLFPTAHFNYELPAQNVVQISYSRRVQRPRFWDLNPFFTFSDNRNFFSGNPDLDPEFSHSLELSHIKYMDKGSLSSSLYYRQTDGIIQRIRIVDQEGNSITRPENLATEDAYGLDVTASYEFAKWWRFNANVNLFRFVVDGSNVDDSFGADNFSWFTRGTSQFKIAEKTDLQVRFNYEAPQQQAQGTRKSMTSVDLAASQDIFKDKATLTLSVRDLFNSRLWRYTFEGDNFFTEGERRWRVRQVMLTLNYRLNQDKKRSGGRDQNREGGGDGDF